MAMTGGSVAIDAGGVASGTGLARELYDALLIKYPTIPAGAGGVGAKTNLADLCNVIGPCVVSHITAHAEVTTTIAEADAGLQRTPDPNTAATDTTGPSAPKTLATKGTIV